ncbi:MAG: hypothetical protein U0359_33030 [Byssovorax sp.]
MTRPFLALAVLALSFSACADTTMHLEDFDTSCTTGADCVTVFANVCGCDCDEVAINKSEEERYNDERATKYEHCEQLTCGACPDSKPAVCLNKVCTIK